MIRVGQKLHEERVRLGLSLEDVAMKTKIRTSFLSAIEKGDYHKLPSPAYVKGFVMNYTEALGLPKKEMLALFRREFSEEDAYRVLPEGFTSHDKLQRFRIRFHQSIIFLAALVFLVGGFLLYQFRAAFFNPPLTVDMPKDRSVVQEEIVVSGKTDPTMTVEINSQPIALESDGKFLKKIVAFPGQTKVTIIAKNRIGRTTTIERVVQVK